MTNADIDYVEQQLAATTLSWPQMVKRYGADWSKWPQSTKWWQALAKLDAQRTVTAPPPAPTGVWWAGPQPPDTSYGHLTPTREITTSADLMALLKAGGTLKPGEVVLVKKSASGSGTFIWGIRLADYADVIFEDGWRWDATPSSWPGIWINPSKLRCYGGVVSSVNGGNVTAHNGGDGIKIVNENNLPTDLRWWGFKIEGAAGQGIGAMCNGSQIQLDLQGEIENWGVKYADLDPHTYEKGTGLHGAYLGGGNVVVGTTKCSGRAILYCHDGYPGAAWSCGANMQDFEVWLSVKHLTWTHDRLAGAGFQQWGQNNRNVTVKNLLVDDAQMATFFESLSSGPVTVEYGRYKNIRLSPAYQTSSHVTFGDWQLAT